MEILNLTQHEATPEQRAAGVIDLPADRQEVLQDLLTFIEIPDPDRIWARAHCIARFAKACGAKAAMIGGAPYLMGPLTEALHLQGITPLFAFSRREVTEETDPKTGEVRKTSVFRHLGFVEGAI